MLVSNPKIGGRPWAELVIDCIVPSRAEVVNPAESSSVIDDKLSARAL